MSTDSSPEQELAAFGQAVRELREQRGMSLDALSRAGRLPRGRKMSARRISRIEAGEVDPPLRRDDRARRYGRTARRRCGSSSWLTTTPI